MDNRGLLFVTRTEWKFALAGSIASFLLASLVLFGWPNFFPAFINKPFLYAGDGLAIDWLAQRAIEGWIFDNPRSGFPFGSSFLDYPGSDTGNFLIYKLLGLLSGSVIPAVNLHFMLSFPAVFLTTFLVLRYFEVRRAYAMCFAMLFTFAPFHFARYLYGHLLYTWYFCVPLFYYYGYKLALGKALFNLRSFSGALSLITIAALLSSFGVYFAFFGVIVIIVCAIFGSIQQTSGKPIYQGALFSVAIFIGVVANLAPNIIDRATHGQNPEVAQRIALETEVYSLKTIHLLLPQPDHRISKLSEFTKDYQRTFPLSNTTSYIGVVGIAGLLVILATIMAALAGKNIDRRISLAAIVVLAVMLTATTGGFSVVFAMLITPVIRGWDRIAIFINFGCLLALAITLNGARLNRLYERVRYAPLAIATAITTIGLIDQTTNSYRAVIDGAAAIYDIDSNFIKKIEETLPPQSAVYQLPYFAFPESAPKNNLSVYTLGSAFFNSQTLRWSFGGIRGREGDLFYRALEQKSAEEQIEAVKKLGFSAIYIDRRGYADRADTLIADFTKLLGPPALTRADGEVVLFVLKK